MDELDHGFEAMTPHHAPDLMRGYGGMWWIAGGWALDLVGGGPTREHIDLDIGVFREDVVDLFVALDHLEIHAAAGGRLIQMSRPGDAAPDANSLWARNRGAEIWLFELILNDSEGDDWVYRRDPRIRLPRSSVTVEVDGLRCLRPEIQLLFKSKHMRDRDVADFDTHAPDLGAAAKLWLRESISLSHPDHPWIERL